MATPTTAEISANFLAQLEAQLNQVIPLPLRAFNRVLARAIAAIFVLVYKRSEYIGLQMLVQTASFRETTFNGRRVRPLVFWGELLRVGRPTAATRAEHTATVAVVNAGGTINAGALLYYPPNGFTYRVVAPVPISGTSVTISVRAVSDQAGGGGRGAGGNLVNGAELRFSQPQAGTAQSATVASQVTAGADEEAEGTYRRRVIETWRARPQGGAYADYRLWSELVPGIIRGYPYRGTPGIVNVYCEATPESSGSPDGIPTAAQLAAVLNSLQFNPEGIADRSPVWAFPFALPISRTNYIVAVVGLSATDQAGVEAAVRAAVEQYFTSRDLFITGLDFPPRTDTIQLNQILGVVSDVADEFNGSFTSLSYSVEGVGTPLTNTQLAEGTKASADVTFAP